MERTNNFIAGFEKRAFEKQAIGGAVMRGLKRIDSGVKKMWNNQGLKTYNHFFSPKAIKRNKIGLVTAAVGLPTMYAGKKIYDMSNDMRPEGPGW